MEKGILQAELQAQENTLSILTIPAGSTEGSVSFQLSQGNGPYAAIIPVNDLAKEAFVSANPRARIMTINFDTGLTTQVKGTFTFSGNLPWSEDLKCSNYNSVTGSIDITITPQTEDVSYFCIGAKSDSAEQFLGEFLINKVYVGESVTGEVFLTDEESIVAKVGAEIFNDYENNIATGEYSHAEGAWTQATGNYAHAEGNNTKVSKDCGHAEGLNTVVSGPSGHAEGSNTEVTQQAGHAEGIEAKVWSVGGHAEGLTTLVTGNYAHAEGQATIAASEYQHVQGRYNIEDGENTYAHIVGNGDSEEQRSNAYTLDWYGNGEYQGTVKSAGIVLISPSGYPYLITIDDDGSFVATQI